jgi:hypothetical protein
MKYLKKIIFALLILLIIITIGGLFLPKERMATSKTIVDKIYFFVMSDISNHYNEASWRSDLDTVIQKEDMDGLQVWMEKYTNGDSALIKTLKTTEADLVREVIEPFGKDRLRVIQLKDFGGTKTAIKMSEEIVIGNPITRILYLFDDKSEIFVNQYLKDLRTKYKNEPEDEFGEDDYYYEEEFFDDFDDETEETEEPDENKK